MNLISASTHSDGITQPLSPYLPDGGPNLSYCCKVKVIVYRRPDADLAIRNIISPKCVLSISWERDQSFGTRVQITRIIKGTEIALHLRAKLIAHRLDKGFNMIPKTIKKTASWTLGTVLAGALFISPVREAKATGALEYALLSSLYALVAIKSIQCSKDLGTGTVTCSKPVSAAEASLSSALQTAAKSCESSKSMCGSLQVGLTAGIESITSEYTKYEAACASDAQASGCKSAREKYFLAFYSTVQHQKLTRSYCSLSTTTICN